MKRATAVLVVSKIQVPQSITVPFLCKFCYLKRNLTIDTANIQNIHAATDAAFEGIQGQLSHTFNSQSAHTNGIFLSAIHIIAFEKKNNTASSGSVFINRCKHGEFIFTIFQNCC